VALELALPVSIGCISAETMVPERGWRVSSLRHRGLAGVEPGHYGDNGSDGEGLLEADTVAVGVAAPARPAQRCFPSVGSSRQPTKASRLDQTQRVLPYDNGAQHSAPVALRLAPSRVTDADAEHGSSATRSAHDPWSGVGAY